MGNIEVQSYLLDNGARTLALDFYPVRHITLGVYTTGVSVVIYSITKRDLEYISSELKRIADSMES